jgi:hypothetical protein
MSPLLSAFPSRMALLKAVLTCCALLKILNRLLKPWYSPSPLRHLPGPPSQSWFAGTIKICHPPEQAQFLCRAGNLGQLFTAKGLPFHQELVDLYGGMVKVYGFFGVSMPIQRVGRITG